MKLLTAVTPVDWPPIGGRCLDGELVWLPPRCGRPRCSCLGAFTGCVTHGFTPTARVKQLDTTPIELLEMLAERVCTDCWPRTAIPALADELIALAARFRVGAIVARGPRGGVRELGPVARAAFGE